MILLGVVLVGFVLMLALVVGGAKLVSSQIGAMQAVTAGVERRLLQNDATGLAPFTPPSIGAIAQEVQGAAWYVRPLGGRLRYFVSGSLLSVDGVSTLAVFTSTRSTESGEEKIEVLAQGTRIGMFLQQRVWQIFVGSAALGGFAPVTGALLQHGREVGRVTPGPGGLVVTMHGVPVATIAVTPVLVEHPSAIRSPLVHLHAPPSPETASWLLALATHTVVVRCEVGPGAT